MRSRSAFVVAVSPLVFALAVTLGAQGQQTPPAGPPPAGAQGGGRPGGGPGGAPQAPQNIKVLPKEWTLQQIRTVMQAFVTSLGQQAAPQGGPAAAPGMGEGCLHCHAQGAPNPNAAPGRGPAPDYVSDANPKKDIARKMIQMVMDINKATASIGDTAVVEKVTCFTCHAGKPKPAIMPEGGWGRGGFSLLPAGPPAGGGPGRGAH